MPATLTATRSVFRRFRRNRRGSAAVEFALVAPVFFALLFAIIETAIMFFASQALESLTQDSARQVLTGQAQAAHYQTPADFIKGVVCPNSATTAEVLFTCTNISVDVEKFSSFTSVALVNPVSNGVFNPGVLGYNAGTSCDVVIVRLFYQWPLFVTGLGYNIANLSNGQRLLTATAAFRNEPYNGACPS
jgi:Flp pilus assembly protein TadG